LISKYVSKVLLSKIGIDIELRIGASAGSGEYLERTLRAGFHSLSFTPAGDFHVEISSRADVKRMVDSIHIAPSGDMVLPTPWGENCLRSLRILQSANIVYVASGSGAGSLQHLGPGHGYLHRMAGLLG